ncbi:MAG: hypothetical protein FWD12_08510 [Alphaproteobacteria bacterium]|nr:hypothetical protein [Alphaproteobacteria bacterium]
MTPAERRRAAAHSVARAIDGLPMSDALRVVGITMALLLQQIPTENRAGVMTEWLDLLATALRDTENAGEH